MSDSTLIGIKKTVIAARYKLRMTRIDTTASCSRTRPSPGRWCLRILRSAGRAQSAGCLLVALLATGCQTGTGAGTSPGVTPAGGAPGSSLSRHKERKLAEISPFGEHRRWQTHVAIGELFDRLWLRPANRKVVKKGKTATFGRYPNLHLEDRDEDGRAEFYGYLPGSGSGETQEFGVFFDLSGDGRADWIVFYGGSLMTKQVKVFFWHHNAIDTNADGRFDVRVYGAIDMDRDGFPEEGATAWVYDTDHDGLVDRAEHIIDGRITPIAPEGGALPLRYILSPELSKQPRIGGEMPTELFRLIANDVNALSEK